jgi:hypothetical protein
MQNGEMVKTVLPFCISDFTISFNIPDQGSTMTGDRRKAAGWILNCSLINLFL